MHVFIDTNILLKFFHFSNDDLDALRSVFTAPGVDVYLTDQVRDEFKRNRESKIKDALRRFKDTSSKAQVPHFMKGYQEHEEVMKLYAQLEEKKKSMMERAKSDIRDERLAADLLIKDIFRPTMEKATDAAFMDAVFDEAWKRVTRGNPPGKRHSIGDAINWVTLLRLVPDENALHVVSEDGDYYSVLDEKAHPFLREEWTRRKNSELHVYRTLPEFTNRHFEEAKLSFDKEKEELIYGLRNSNSFAMTHQIVEKLEAHAYFSLKEVNGILKAVLENNQVGWIVGDRDVSSFLNRIAVPRIDDIENEEYRRILHAVRDQSPPEI